MDKVKFPERCSCGADWIQSEEIGDNMGGDTTVTKICRNLHELTAVLRGDDIAGEGGRTPRLFVTAGYFREETKSVDDTARITVNGNPVKRMVVGEVTPGGEKEIVLFVDEKSERKRMKLFCVYFDQNCPMPDYYIAEISLERALERMSEGGISSVDIDTIQVVGEVDIFT